MLNKRGQGLPTSTIILLILGLVILIVLIFGFATGWSAFKNLLSPTNVDDVVADCNTICGLDQKYAFCSAERILRSNEDKVEVKTSCAVLSSSPNFAKYSIQACPSIQCDLACESITIDSKAGSKELTSGVYDVTSLATGLTEDQKCFIN